MTMRLVNLVSGVLAALVWGYFLYRGIMFIEMVACANLPDFRIAGSLTYNVIVPTTVLVLVVTSVAVTNWVKQPGRAIALLPCAALVGVLIYYAFATGISITDAALGNCPF
jgi:hypothetical protein